MKGKRMYLHTPQAIESATPTRDYTGWDLDSHAEAHEWAGVGLVPVSQHRDSEAWERSNFDTAIAELSAAFGADSVAIVRFGHWAVGWVETLTHNTGIEGITEAIEGIEARLAEYPILDEFRWSEYEWADNHPEDDDKCWAEDDCECGLAKV
jgi:hypothetical protein